MKYSIFALALMAIASASAMEELHEVVIDYDKREGITAFGCQKGIKVTTIVSKHLNGNTSAVAYWSDGSTFIKMSPSSLIVSELARKIKKYEENMKKINGNILL